jgi:hypothetical protein
MLRARDGNRYTLPSRAPASFMLLIILKGVGAPSSAKRSAKVRSSEARGGFLPGGRLDCCCLGMGDRDQILGPGPLA